MHRPYPCRWGKPGSRHAGKRKIAECGTNSGTPAKNTNWSTRSAGSRNSVRGAVFYVRSGGCKVESHAILLSCLGQGTDDSKDIVSGGFFTLVRGHGRVCTTSRGAF